MLVDLRRQGPGNSINDLPHTPCSKCPFLFPAPCMRGSQGWARSLRPIWRAPHGHQTMLGTKGPSDWSINANAQLPGTKVYAQQTGARRVSMTGWELMPDLSPSVPPPPPPPKFSKSPLPWRLPLTHTHIRLLNRLSKCVWRAGGNNQGE